MHGKLREDRDETKRMQETSAKRRVFYARWSMQCDCVSAERDDDDDEKRREKQC